VDLDVRRLQLYPVKAARGTAVGEAEVEWWGLKGDRRWAVIDERDQRLSAPTCPSIMTVTAALDADGGLVLTAPGAAPLIVAPPTGAEQVVSVGSSGLGLRLAGDPGVHRWLSGVLGCSARLVWLDDPTRRPVPAGDGGRPGDVVSLAHAGPLLLTSGASLRRLDAWISEAAPEEAARPLDMVRFRPNVVIDGDLAGAFAEEDWASVRIGEVAFRVAAPCYRCAVTLIDPDTLERGKEPLRTLARRRRPDGKVYFGVWLVPLTLGSIRVGDRVLAG
jgi:uncharacterized protein YcbX